MKNKFINTIAGTADGIKLKRAENTANAAKLAQESLINDLRKDVQAIDAQLTAALDIGPETSDSLRPVGRDFNAQAWVLEVQTIKVSAKRAQEKLEIAEATYQEWFGENAPAVVS